MRTASTPVPPPNSEPGLVATERSAATLHAKAAAGARIAVCIPALNEEPTIGRICGSVRDRLMGPDGFVDELIVLDAGSTDQTAEAARTAGAVVRAVDDVLPGVEAQVPAGKGEAMWRSLAATDADLVVWLDGDITNFAPQFVSELVWPLLSDPDIVMTKAFYKRPLGGEDLPFDNEAGGRVTELAIRPLVNLLAPEIAHIVQPLGGECAIRRDVAIRLPFVTNYGVDLALVMDVAARHGSGSIAQVDVGRRTHRNRDVLELGRMSFEIMQAMITRLSEARRIELADPIGEVLTQFRIVEGKVRTMEFSPVAHERPPMVEALGSEVEV